MAASLKVGCAATVILLASLKAHELRDRMTYKGCQCPAGPLRAEDLFPRICLNSGIPEHGLVSLFL